MTQQSSETKVAVMQESVKRMETDIKEIKENTREVLIQMNDTFVSKTEFKAFQEEMKLIKNIVFGFVGMILVAVGGAIIALVVAK